jgi:hypothetical protein
MRLFRTNTFDWGHDLHHGKGNLRLADGSVHITKAKALNAQVAAQPDSFFDWFIPY